MSAEKQRGKRPKLLAASHRAQPGENTQAAWWYENLGSIDVIVEKIGGGAYCCRISKRAIKAWLRRVEL